MARLYRNVDFEIPLSRPPKRPGTPILRDPVTQSVRRMTFRTRAAGRRNSVYNRRSISDTGSVDGCVNEILDKIPLNKLTSFA
jgi:hypothetical protein